MDLPLTESEIKALSEAVARLEKIVTELMGKVKVLESKLSAAEAALEAEGFDLPW